MARAISIGAAGAAAGLIVGVLLASGRTGALPLGGPVGSSTSTSTSTGTGTSTGADPEAQLAAAIERLDRAAAALEAAANAMKGSATALGEARAASGTDAGTGGDARRLGGGEAGAPVTVVSPGERAPGALVPWLPPEGVPLVKSYFRTRLGESVRKLEQEGARQSMGGLQELRRRMASEALEALETVTDELALARWVDSHGGAVQAPKPWQLAEFAKTWDGK